MSGCGCGGAMRLVYACSGCSDVGEIADRAARALSKGGFGKMTCLAGVGAHVSGFVESAKGADEAIAIDGCPIACARKTLEHAGVSPRSYVLTDMGLVKGKTPVTAEVVQTASRLILEKDVKIRPEADRPGAGSGCCGY